MEDNARNAPEAERGFVRRSPRRPHSLGRGTRARTPTEEPRSPRSHRLLLQGGRRPRATWQLVAAAESSSPRGESGTLGGSRGVRKARDGTTYGTRQRIWRLCGSQRARHLCINVRVRAPRDACTTRVRHMCRRRGSVKRGSGVNVGGADMAWPAGIFVARRCARKAAARGRDTAPPPV